GAAFEPDLWCVVVLHLELFVLGLRALVTLDGVVVLHLELFVFSLAALVLALDRVVVLQLELFVFDLAALVVTLDRVVVLHLQFVAVALHHPRDSTVPGCALESQQWMARSGIGYPMGFRRTGLVELRESFGFSSEFGHGTPLRAIIACSASPAS